MATQRFLRGFFAPPEPQRPVAGIVPHAGWQYSGAVAAKVFEAIREKAKPATFVIFGAVHRWAGINGVDAHGAWATPLGDIEVDEPLADIILREAADWLLEDPRAHVEEHSIEVELPFVRYLFPQAKFVPIAVNPDDRAVPLGQTIGEILKSYPMPSVVIGSTDLTHYGDMYRFTPAGYGREAHRWMRQNDQRIVELAQQMRGSEVIPEAREHHNACGAGAMAATLEAAKVLGADRGYCLDYTTSYDVAPEGDFEMAVGYAGLVF